MTDGRSWRSTNDEQDGTSQTPNDCGLTAIATSDSSVINMVESFDFSHSMTEYS